MKRMIFTAFLALALAPSLASAQPYIVLDAGLAAWDVDRDVLQDGSLSGELDRGDLTFGARLGFPLNETLGLEVGYRDLGEASFDGSSNGAGSFWCPGPVDASMEATVIEASLLAAIQANPRVGFFGRLGMARWDAEATLSDSCGTLTGDDDGTDLTLGAGAEFLVSEEVSLRANWQRYTEIFEENVDTFTGSIVLRF